MSARSPASAHDTLSEAVCNNNSTACKNNSPGSYLCKTFDAGGNACKNSSSEKSLCTATNSVSETRICNNHSLNGDVCKTSSPPTSTNGLSRTKPATTNHEAPSQDSVQNGDSKVMTNGSADVHHQSAHTCKSSPTQENGCLDLSVARAEGAESEADDSVLPFAAVSDLSFNTSISPKKRGRPPKDPSERKRQNIPGRKRGRPPMDPALRKQKVPIPGRKPGRPPIDPALRKRPPMPGRKRGRPKMEFSVPYSLAGLQHMYMPAGHQVKRRRLDMNYPGLPYDGLPHDAEHAHDLSARSLDLSAEGHEPSEESQDSSMERLDDVTGGAEAFPVRPVAPRGEDRKNFLSNLLAHNFLPSILGGGVDPPKRSPGRPRIHPPKPPGPKRPRGRPKKSDLVRESLLSAGDSRDLQRVVLEMGGGESREEPSHPDTHPSTAKPSAAGADMDFSAFPTGSSLEEAAALAREELLRSALTDSEAETAEHPLPPPPPSQPVFPGMEPSQPVFPGGEVYQPVFPVIEIKPM